MNKRQQGVCIDSEIQSKSEIQAFPRSRIRRYDWQRKKKVPGLITSQTFSITIFLPARRVVHSLVAPWLYSPTYEKCPQASSSSYRGDLWESLK